MATTGPGLRERKRLELRRRLATTAVELFLDRGFDEVSVAEVAEAAGVSKMTVFNHFPAKEDLVFELAGESRLPDLAAAVRERAEGVTPIDAVRDRVLKDLRDNAVHDREQLARLARFLRMAFRSPTLLERFGREWRVVQQDLSAELAAVAGHPPLPDDMPMRLMQAMRGDDDAKAVAAWLDDRPEGALGPYFAAGQITSTLQQVTMANLLRVAAGVDPEEAAKASIRDAELAFGLLAGGLSGFGR